VTSARSNERLTVIETGSRLAVRLRSRAVVVPVALWAFAQAAIFGWAFVAREAALSLGGHHAAVGPSTLLDHWDTAYFAGIAEHGYVGPGTGATWRAFFPGFPLQHGC
jgi:hypothetical protein